MGFYGVGVFSNQLGDFLNQESESVLGERNRLVAGRRWARATCGCKNGVPAKSRWAGGDASFGGKPLIADNLNF